jgi:hypothetical protein
VKLPLGIVNIPTLLPVRTVATAVKAVCQFCGTVTVRDSNPHCHCIRPHCYQYVR